MLSDREVELTQSFSLRYRAQKTGASSGEVARPARLKSALRFAVFLAICAILAAVILVWEVSHLHRDLDAARITDRCYRFILNRLQPLRRLRRVSEGRLLRDWRLACSLDLHYSSESLQSRFSMSRQDVRLPWERRTGSSGLPLSAWWHSAPVSLLSGRSPPPQAGSD